MSFLEIGRDDLTTREASVLLGRSQDSVKGALTGGVLRGTRTVDGWRVNRSDLLAWNAAHPARPSVRRSDIWDRAADVLVEFGPLAPEELAVLLERHPGNARKYLAILEKQGRAARLDNGHWVAVRDEVGAA